MIQPGLARISSLLQTTNIPWRAIHVAGTNGKGSVCAYASAMLAAGKIRYGRFTSPHLMDRWDCIAINGTSIDESLFKSVEDRVKSRDGSEHIQASEFELLTATAFEVFTQEKVDVGIIEVGMGGRHDATNVLENPFVTVITKIGKDHQSFLGNTLEEIADQKAGIMKKNAPCIVDSTNPKEVLDLFQNTARNVGAALVLEVPLHDDESDKQIWSVIDSNDYEPHQKVNLCLAYEAVKQTLVQLGLSVEPSKLLSGIQPNLWPGRLQQLSIEALTGRKELALLDGAHNGQSAEVLGSFVDRKIRHRDSPVTWVIAMSAGKITKDLLSPLLKLGDNVVATEFGPVEGMPWASGYKGKSIIEAAEGMGSLGQTYNAGSSVLDALLRGAEISQEGPLVIAGSLYLVSDVMRLLRQVQLQNTA